MQAHLTGAFSYVGATLGRMLACMMIWIFLVITPSSEETRPAASALERAHSRDPPSAPHRVSPIPLTSYSVAPNHAVAGGANSPASFALSCSGHAPPIAGMPPGVVPFGNDARCTLPVSLTAKSFGGPAGGGGITPRGSLSAQQQTRTYLRWKAAIALGKALTCGLIYALTGLPLWPVFALLVFWLHWVPIVGSVIAIVMPLPLVSEKARLGLLP